MAKTFKGVIFYGPRDVRVQERPFPRLEDCSENNAIVKVVYAGTIIQLTKGLTRIKACVAVTSTV
jgi:hypothetical protein